VQSFSTANALLPRLRRRTVAHLASGFFIVARVQREVDIGVRNGAVVYPDQWKDESVHVYAESKHTVLTSFDRMFDAGYALAPTSLLSMPSGARLILPSPKGS
jgi:hypothetical protein